MDRHRIPARDHDPGRGRRTTGDLYGRRRFLLLGIGIFTAASAACGFAPTLASLIAARAAQGLGAAAMMALALPFVADTVAKEKTGRAMGTLATTSAIGTALGPSLVDFSSRLSDGARCLSRRSV